METRRRILKLAGCAALAVLALALSACASGGATTSLDAATRARLAEQGPIQVAVHPPAPFVLTTPGKAVAGGLFGVVGMGIAANSMQKAGERLVAEPLASDALPQIQRQLGSGLLLDVRTLNWQLVYYPAPSAATGCSTRRAPGWCARTRRRSCGRASAAMPAATQRRSGPLSRSSRPTAARSSRPSCRGRAAVRRGPRGPLRRPRAQGLRL